MTDKAITRFEDVKDLSTEEYFKGNQFSIDVFNKKYAQNKKETYVIALKRVCDYIAQAEETEELRKYWSERWFDEIYNDWWHPAGSIMQGAGSDKSISLANCTTLSLGGQEDTNWDNLESIIKNTAYTVAKTAAFRQGLGVDFSKLRPRGLEVKNSSNESQGVVHWMKFIDSIGNYIGQKGRIPAMLFSLSVDHPDVEEFIKVKSDYTIIQNANISVQTNDAFYKAVEEDAEWEMSFEIPEVKIGQKIYIDVHSIDSECLKDEKGYYKVAKKNREGEKIVKKTRARDLLELIAKNMTANAEPGIQQIDMARKWSNSDYVYDPNDSYNSKVISSNAPVVGSSLVPTRNGLLKIEELYNLESSDVLADTLTTFPKKLIFKEKNSYSSFETKTFFINSKFKKFENQQVYEIKMSDGTLLKCNEDHMWFVNGEFKKTKDIIVGDKIHKPNGGIYQAYDLSTNMNSDSFKEGQLIGYFVGDGWVGKESASHNKMIGIVFTNDSRYYADLFKKKYFEISGKELSYERNRETCFELRAELPKFVKYFESFGFVDDKYHVPERCYTDFDFCAGFLNGLFNADGNFEINKRYKVTINRIVLTSVSENLINCVNSLLSGIFGIHSVLHNHSSKPVPYTLKNGEKKLSRHKDAYALNISTGTSVLRFKNFIGNEGSKGDKLNSFEDTKRHSNIIYSAVKSIVKTNNFEDMYCAVVPYFRSFIINGFVSSNCSEQYLSRESLCVLASLNVATFSIEKDKYTEELRKIAYSVNRFLDNVNTMEIRGNTYATPHQKMAIEKLRRTGGGSTNIAGWLFKQNLEYGSIEANDAMYDFNKTYNYFLYESSIGLGKEKGSFGLFVREKYEQSPFIKNMMEQGLVFEAMRNVTCSSLAPTGSLSTQFRDFVMSYGVEPGFGMYFWKRTRMSGKYEYYFCVPGVVREFFKNAGYEINMQSDCIKDTWDGAIGLPIAKFIDENAKKIGIKFKRATEVKVLDKLDLMSKLMKHVDSSISVTYMLPEGSSWKDTYDLIIEANRKGVKSIAAFPDKKMYGIVSYIPFKTLAFNLKNEGVEIYKANFTDAEYAELNIVAESKNATNNAPKRKKDLYSDLYQVNVRGHKYLIAVGIQDGTPYEIFGGLLTNGLSVKIPKKGIMVKEKSGQYKLTDIDGNILIEDFGSLFSGSEQILFRMVSTSLRHGIPIKFLTDQLSKAAEDVSDLASATSRVLKKYISNGEKAGGKCPSCGKQELIYIDGCVSCTCGWSKGCG